MITSYCFNFFDVRGWNGFSRHVWNSAVFSKAYLCKSDICSVIQKITEIYQNMINQVSALFFFVKGRKHVYYRVSDSHRKILQHYKTNICWIFARFGLSIQKPCYCRVWCDRVIVTRVIIGCKLTELYSMSSSHRQKDQ